MVQSVQSVQCDERSQLQRSQFKNTNQQNKQMCGIVGCLKHSADVHQEIRKFVLKGAKAIRHRGPDWSGIAEQEFTVDGAALASVVAHERLGIVDPAGGAQPIRTDSGTICGVNGEIYNHQLLRVELQEDRRSLKSASDCEVIPHLWEKYGVSLLSTNFVQDEFVDRLDGVFAFVCTSQERWILARDAIGVMPLYVAFVEDQVWFASEMKALVGLPVQEFPPGHYLSSQQPKTFVRW